MKAIKKFSVLSSCIISLFIGMSASSSVYAFKHKSQSAKSSAQEPIQPVEIEAMMGQYIKPFSTHRSVTGSLAALDAEKNIQVRQISFTEANKKLWFYANHNNAFGKSLVHGDVTAMLVSDDHKTAIEVIGGTHLEINKKRYTLGQYSLDPKDIYFYKVISSGQDKKITIRQIETFHAQWRKGHWYLVGKSKNSCYGSDCFA